MIGAECKQGNKISLIDEVQSDLDEVHFIWTREPQPQNSVSMPVYLYSDRSNLLFTVDFIPENFEKLLLYERGVALIGNSLIG